MQRSLCQFLGAGDADPVDLVDDQRIVFLFVLGPMKDDLGAMSTELDADISRPAVRIRIQADPVADPAEEAVSFDGIVVGLQISLEALLADRDPEAPQERIGGAMDGDLQDSANEAVRALVVGDGANVAVEGGHARLFFFRQRYVGVGSPEREGRRSFVDLAAAAAFEGEDGGHGSGDVVDVWTVLHDTSGARQI